jgi:hypothetical protein
MRTLVLGAALVVGATGCHVALRAGGAVSRNTPTTAAPLVTPGLPGSGSPPGTAATAPAPVPGAGDDNLMTLSGSARSVQTTASVTGLSSVQLAGSLVLTATGDVVDRNGRDLGTGSLRAQDTDVTVTAPGSSMYLASQLRVQLGLVTVNAGGSGSIGLGFSGSATIAGANLTFQPPPPPPPAPPATPAAGAPATVAPTTTVPPPRAVAGPVTLRADGLQIAGSNLTLVNPPASVTVSSSEADLSWAGSGTITTAQGPLQAPYLGVRAQDLQATLVRTGGAVTVHGTGLALQAYANGIPQLRVAAAIDVLSTHATTGFFNLKPAFVWTPRNYDNTYDMAILSIHPGNAAARGVHVGLLPMPPMFGGEPHALVGGDTAGLKSGDAIDSLIARNGDDKRSIGYDAPPGVPLVLIVQGNFPTITVTVTTY